MENESKEIGEVFTAIESLLSDIRAKKPISEIAVGNFAKLQAAVEGYDKLEEELKDKQRSFPTIGFHVGKILASF